VIAARWRNVAVAAGLDHLDTFLARPAHPQTEATSPLRRGPLKFRRRRAFFTTKLCGADTHTEMKMTAKNQMKPPSAARIVRRNRKGEWGLGGRRRKGKFELFGPSSFPFSPLNAPAQQLVPHLGT
jgi:hypothetical protein